MRILAVDDDPDVLQALVAALGTLPGHEVRSAGSGDEAYQTALSEGGFDLLVTDVVMDPVDGLSLRHALLAPFPELRTVFISGYDLSGYAEAIGSVPLLAKPIDLAALRAAVESELAQVPGVSAESMMPAAPEAPAEPVSVVAPPEPVLPAAPAEPAAPVAPAAVEDAPPVTSVPAAVVPPAPAAAPAAPAVPAVPVARPTAAPTVKATPAAMTMVAKARPAVPAATPAQPTAAVPKAVPGPTAVAVPKAVPAAPKAVSAPKAIPTASPAATPKAVSAPKAVPAAPTAAAAPKATAVPKAVPAVRPPAVPAAVPKATAAPRAAPTVARAAGAPRVAVPAAVPAPPAPRPPSTFAPELLGRTIGGYQISSLLGEGRWGPVFSAVQVAINRPVGFKLLAPERAADPEQKERFIADARAKANVQHPSILSVYEAGSAEGWIFYTQEYVDGHNLADLAAAGQKIDQPTALRILRAAAEAAIYFERNTAPHAPLAADNIYLTADGQPRLSNPATQHSDQQTSPGQEVEALGRAVLGLLPAGPEITPGLRALLGRSMRSHSSPLADWAAVLQGVKALEPKVVPVEAARISAQDRAAVEAVEKARQQQKRAFLLNVGVMVSLLLLAAAVGWYVFIRSNERRLTAQIHIPAGDFVSGTGTPSHNEEFWIDKYEVTLGQYGRFVQWIEANSADEHQFDHPRQPRQLSHIPQYWQVYYGNAEAGRAAHSVRISLNSPAITVTWWDAYAYAKWKGRELPTALEWERAARGTKGAAYPWGEQADPKNANTSADYNARNPAQKGTIDGFNFWGDVDRLGDDKSPDGVIGMAGNVSEWTNSWTKGNKNPILKGGNFSIPLQTLDFEITDQTADASQEFIGFRTISRRAPEK